MVIISRYVGDNVETKTQTITIFSGTAPLLRATGEKYILPYKISLNVRYPLTVKSNFSK